MTDCSHCIQVALAVVGVVCVLAVGHEWLYRIADRERMDELILRSAAALESADITYWAISGTLFGAHVDKRTRYADFDGDLSVLVADADKVRNLPWKSHGLLLYEGFGGFRVKSSTFNTLRVDIILVYDEKACACMRFGWPALESPPFSYELVPSEYIFPLQRSEYATGFIFVPNRTDELLHWQYGQYKFEPPVGFRQLLMATIEKQGWTRIMPLVHIFGPTMPY